MKEWLSIVLQAPGSKVKLQVSPQCIIYTATCRPKVPQQIQFKNKVSLLVLFLSNSHLSSYRNVINAHLGGFIGRKQHS